jgi:DNA-3-methyladenine glycosylase
MNQTENSIMRLGYDFYEKDVLEIAPALLGQYLVCVSDEGIVNRYIITETEAYRGEEDLACHASKGRTQRTEIMYGRGGSLYIYLIYGMYWMMNVVAGKMNEPQAALIRGIQGFEGPGKLTRALGITKAFYGEDLVQSDRIWITESGATPKFITTPRVGIEYAGKWKNKPWRFLINVEK